jgi:lipase chaperone LimK
MPARRKPGRWVAGLAAVAAVLTGIAPRPSASVPATAAPAPAIARTSLAGTTPDGAATASADDQLRLSPALIRLFDYWLSTTGELPLAEIRAQAERDLDGRLGPTAARQAKDLLARYFAFKSALKLQRPAQSGPGRGVDALRAGLRTMLSLRARYFSAEESQVLFGADDARATASLARMEIEQDPALDAAQRRARLAALDASLPADERAARDAPLAVIRLNDAAARLRAQGGSEDDVYRLRAAAVSPEAANRLADLDRDEAAWQARIAAYRAERARLLAAPDDEARQSSLAALRQRLFTPEEQRRLVAYEG